MKKIFFISLVLINICLIGIGSMGCTLGGFTGSIAADDGIAIVQTCDSSWWPTRHILYVFQPEDGYKFIATKSGIWGVTNGINSEGLSILAAAVDSKDEYPKDGDIDMYDFGVELFKNCATVDEAIEMLKTFKLTEPNWTRNLLLADTNGVIAVVAISKAKVLVETYITDGYIVRTNHWLTDEMKALSTREEDYRCDRFERGIKWWEETKKYVPKFRVEDLFDYAAYVYEPLQLNKISGPGACLALEPKKGIFWFTFGWPGGNLPTKELENWQINQDMTWGVWLPFNIKELPPGQYTTEIGHLTPLAIQYLYSHFSQEIQRSPNWYKYQSVDPLKPFYKPAEDIVSPDPYAPRLNPYCPAGKPGTWTEEEGFIVTTED